MGKNILLMLVGLIIFMVQPTMARDQHSWLVAKLKGQAWIAQKGTKPLRVKKGMYLQPGQTLSTKSRTRLLLQRGKERIQVGANAILALPPARYMQPGRTTILHQSGRLDLVVNKRDVKHFKVQTPYLAAVVKGTQFTVMVAEGKTDVSVSRGQVGVSSSLSGESSDLSAGQSASLNVTSQTKPALKVGGIGKKPVVRKTRVRKKAPPAFRTMIKIKGKKRELLSGSASNLLSRTEQARRDAEAREKRKNTSNRTDRRTSHVSDFHDRLTGRDHNRSSSEDRETDRPHQQVAQAPAESPDNDNEGASPAPAAPQNEGGSEPSSNDPSPSPGNPDSRNEQQDDGNGDDNGQDNGDDGNSGSGHGGGGGISINIDAEDGVSVDLTEDPGISVTVTDGDGNTHTWGN